MTYTKHNVYVTAYNNDGVTDKFGRLHAEGAHDINRVASNYNDDGSKQAWHRHDRNRARLYVREQEHTLAGLTRRVDCLKIKRNGRTVYALDATVRKSDGKLLKCLGFSDTPRNAPTSALGKACAR